MKKFGKRTLSMLMASVLTASILVSDLSVMQVNAAGGMDFTAEGESSAVEMMTEEVVEEVSSVEEISEETEEVSLDVVSEETTEAVSEETSGETVEEETTVIETTMESTEEAAVEETIVTEETTVEETATEVVTVEETMVETVEEAPGAVEVAATPQFTIGADANGVMTVEFAEGVTKLSGEVVIPAAVEVIPKNEAYFYTNREVTAVTFETGSLLERIEEDAFFGSAITEIKIPASVSYIGNRAFCTAALKKVTLLSNGTSVEVGDSAFASNADLTTFITNGRLGVIGKSAFAGNAELKTFIKASSYDDGALEGVTQIGESAFSGCSALEYIKIPDTVKSIEPYTFKDCSSLGKSSRDYYTGIMAADLGYGVQEIKDQAFYGCSGLQELILQENVKTLGNSVFNGCTALKTISIYNQSGEDKTDACALELTYTSFPHMKGLTLKAYDGTVKDWVGTHTMYGVKFATLYKEFSVTTDTTIKNGTIKADVTKAKMGTIVTLTVKPAEEYVINYNSLYYQEKDGIRRGEIDPYDYTFEMPEFDVVIIGSFVKLSELEYGDKLVLTDEGLNNKSNDAIEYDETKKILEFPKPWQNVRLEVKGSNDAVPGYDELVFKSDNTKVVTVDVRGNMRVIAQGEANVTVSLADKEKGVEPLTFKVKVGERTYVKNLSLTYTAPKADRDLAENEGEYDTISFPASLLNVESYEIAVKFNGTDEAGDKLDVTYQLSSNDTAVAKPKAAKVIGTGTIVVPKGALGETVITVKAIDGAKEPVQKQFVVRIIDDKPRLANSTITVDPQSDTGTLVDLVSVYGAEPKVSNLTVVKKTVKSGTTIWEDADNLFPLVVEDGKVYLQALESEQKKYTAGQKYTYKNTYYIHGTLNETDEDFYIVIPNLTVCKRKISTPMKVTGKINLFYNGTADIAKLGSVTVAPKNTKTDLKMVRCELVGKEKTNGVNEDDDSAFAENFTAFLDTEKQTITIVRTPGDAALTCYTDGKSKNKPVLNGLLRVWYEGYSEEYYEDIKLTVPTHTTTPSYKLNLAKITLNDNASGQQYITKFVDKKAKKGTDATVDLTEDTIISLDKLNATTSGLVDDNSITIDPENDELTIRINKVKKGKIVLTLRQSDWEDQSGWNKKAAIKATINVAVTTAAPTAKLGKTTFKLNAACPDAADYTTIKLNQTDSALTDVDFTPANPTKSSGIELTYDSATQTVTAAIVGDVSRGTHKFTCVPKFAYATEDGISAERPAKRITVNVSVANTKPSIKLKSSTFTVNANGYKKDERKYDAKTIAFTWANLPSIYSEYTLSSEGTLVYRGRGDDPLEGKAHFVVDGEAKKATVYIESAYKVYGKASYQVTGLELVNDAGDKIAINPFNITVNSINKTPTVTVKAKGTINPLDPASKIEYTPKVTNISGAITGVEMWEYDEFGEPLEDAEEHFVPAHDPATGKTTVKVKDGVQLENRTYKISLFYELENGEDGDGWLDAQKLYEVAKVQQIKPKQTMPKLTIDKTSATFYAGNKERTQTITVTKKDTTTANITGIKFADEKWEKSFKINDFNPATGEMELKLVNSAFIKQGVEQKIRFEIVCEGQLKDTKGRTFDVKVKVLK